jgi:hypothetical protein
VSTSDNSIYPNPHAARQHSDYLEVGYSAAKTTDNPVLLYADVRSFYVRCVGGITTRSLFYVVYSRTPAYVLYRGGAGKGSL